MSAHEPFSIEASGDRIMAEVRSILAETTRLREVLAAARVSATLHTSRPCGEKHCSLCRLDEAVRDYDLHNEREAERWKDL